MWSKLFTTKRGLWILIGILSLILVAVAVWLFGFVLPGSGAENTMPANGKLIISEQESGELLVQWPAGENADSYTLEVLRASGKGYETVYSFTTTGQSCVLPELPRDETLTLRVSCSRSYSGGVRQGTRALEVKLFLDPPTAEVEWSVDTETGLLQMDIYLEEGASCRMYTTENDGEPVYVQDVQTGTVTLRFGEDGDYPVPAYDTSRSFCFEVCRVSEGLEFQGKANAEVVLGREDFLGTGIGLTCEALENNAYSLSWTESKGDRYEVQLSADGGKTWESVYTVEASGERTWVTDYLAPFTDLQLRVVAVDGEAGDGEPYTAVSAVTEISTAQRTVYSTVWPIQDLEVYADAAMTQTLGTAPAGQAYCVLEEADGLFGIRFGDGTGYIRSELCMINLPEYIGDLCSYNITNSYDSLYMVHEYGIDKVSGTVIKGYEKIQLGDGEYVVPLLYPAAKKLVVAAQTALEQGYRLKIYDSFRPNVATLDIYDLAKVILQDPVPKTTFSGKAVEDLGMLSWDPNASDGSESDGEGSETEPSEGADAPTETPTEPEEWDGIIPGLTYEILMTDNGRWSLANFLAQGVSNHNRGIAMDLTLETLDGKELTMQTSMHDLSWYSESSRNNNNAKLLRTIMTDAGFGGLGSEWWHYQDNDARDGLKPPALYWGVSMECWMYDGQGWRYRTATGDYLTSCTKTIDGTAWEFDAQGYVK